MMRILDNSMIRTLLVVFTLSPVQAVADCNWWGGYVQECADKWSHEPMGPIGGVHHSSDVMALSRATCVTPTSEWLFHSARVAPYGETSPWGNEVMLSHLRRFPKVVSWARKAFSDGGDHTMYGVQLNELGVPLCR